jgi:hypothetical protein
MCQSKSMPDHGRDAGAAGNLSRSIPYGSIFSSAPATATEADASL